VAISGAPEDPEDDTVMERDSADALYSAIKSVMHAIWTQNEEAQQNMAYRVIQIVQPWTIGSG
jgi:chorismate mutase